MGSLVLCDEILAKRYEFLRPLSPAINHIGLAQRIKLQNRFGPSEVAKTESSGPISMKQNITFVIQPILSTLVHCRSNSDKTFLDPNHDLEPLTRGSGLTQIIRELHSLSAHN